MKIYLHILYHILTALIVAAIVGGCIVIPALFLVWLYEEFSIITTGFVAVGLLVLLAALYVTILDAVDEIDKIEVEGEEHENMSDLW